jgi:hypothetical protein
MTALTTRRLPGFRFVAQPPALPEKLPRMDIAAFVGFASAGPLHLPVVVEDAAGFQNIFGGDPPLAWDAQSATMLSGHLGPAVRSFFLNGGRRCWVIRVAGQAETDFLALPGMLEWADCKLAPAFASARSPGSWCDGFGAATALAVDSVVIRSMRSTGKLVAQLPTGTEVQAGDLLRIQFEDGLQLYFLVSEIEPTVGSPPSSVSHDFVVRGEPQGWFAPVDPGSTGQLTGTVIWTQSPLQKLIAQGCTLIGGLDASPPIQSDFVELTIPDAPSFPGGSFNPPPCAVLQFVADGGDSLWFMVDTIGRVLAASPLADATTLRGRAVRVLDPQQPLPGTLPVIAEKLTFEMRARNGDTDAVRLTGLGFAWAHPRCWSALPGDDALFDTSDLPVPDTLPDDSFHTGLWSEARENPASGGRFPLAGTRNSAAVYLPLLMQALPDTYFPAEHSNNDELTRDGLVQFAASLFLDEDLVEDSSKTLLETADFIRYEQEIPRPNLRGLHAALAIEEATLIAVPDAVHVGWNLAQVEPVPAPQASGLLPHPGWGLSPTCDYESSPPGGAEPRFDKFLDCELRILQPPVLSAPEVVGESGAFTVTWTSADTDAIFNLQEAMRPDFSDATVIFQGNEWRHAFLGRPFGSYYYRVQAVVGADTSNWSNEAVVTVRAQGRYVTRQIGSDATALFGTGYDPTVLLDVHRSLLRLGGARGDLFSVLTLPEHFNVDQALGYVRLLQSANAESLPYETLTFPLSSGEATAFTYGALYHPWLVTGEAFGELIYSPPDGAAAGILARRSLQRGAWIAPANEICRGAIALEPALDEGRRLDLLLAQINQFTDEPEGFMTLNADTLSQSPELRPINVRRLLILLRRAALRLGNTYVFEPNGPALRRLVQHAFESLLDQLFVRGAFAGATRATSYEVVTDDSVNTPRTADLGQFRVDLRVAPSLPMSFVTVRLIQTGDGGVTMEIL